MADFTLFHQLTAVLSHIIDDKPFGMTEVFTNGHAFFGSDSNAYCHCQSGLYLQQAAAPGLFLLGLGLNTEGVQLATGQFILEQVQDGLLTL